MVPAWDWASITQSQYGAMTLQTTKRTKMIKLKQTEDEPQNPLADIADLIEYGLRLRQQFNMVSACESLSLALPGMEYVLEWLSNPGANDGEEFGAGILSAIETAAKDMSREELQTMAATLVTYNIAQFAEVLTEAPVDQRMGLLQRAVEVLIKHKQRHDSGECDKQPESIVTE